MQGCAPPPQSHLVHPLLAPAVKAQDLVRPAGAKALAAAPHLGLRRVHLGHPRLRASPPPGHTRQARAHIGIQKAELASHSESKCSAQGAGRRHRHTLSVGASARSSSRSSVMLSVLRSARPGARLASSSAHRTSRTAGSLHRWWVACLRPHATRDQPSQGKVCLGAAHAPWNGARRSGRSGAPTACGPPAARIVACPAALSSASVCAPQRAHARSTKHLLARASPRLNQREHAPRCVSTPEARLHSSSRAPRTCTTTTASV